MTINAIGGQTLLGMSSQHGSQIDGTRALRSVEAPDGLRIGGVHVHRLRAVAPARRNGDGTSHTLALELLGTGGTLTHASNRGVADNALYH